MASSKSLTSIWVLLLFCCFSLFGRENKMVDASHKINPHLQSLQAQDSNLYKIYRTGYHFQPPKHWINDPNAPMYYNGVYHLFYQYNPYGAVWGHIVWAHSVSTDLINWIRVDKAFAPSEPFDINGCWSGSATILPGNKPVILYTGVDEENRQVQNIAIPKNLSDPFLREWMKPNYNPLMVPTPINGIDVSSFRDPTTAWLGHDGRWRVLIGSKRARRGVAVLYRSKDFVNWVKARHPLHSVDGTGMWECPDFYPVSTKERIGLATSISGIDVKHVLKVSLDDNKIDYYTIGKYAQEQDRFIPDDASIDSATGLRYDYGKFYASKTFFDARTNRRLLWGWLNESDSENDDMAKGWSGLQAIPRALWLDDNGRQLVQWPIIEIESLRKNQVQLQDLNLKEGTLAEVKGITAAQADVEVYFNLPSLERAEVFDPTWVDPQILCSHKGSEVQGSIGPFGLLILASQNLNEHTAVFFRIFKAQDKHVVLICSDQSRSTLKREVDKTTYGAFVDVDLEDQKLPLRSLIDHSIVESFSGGGRACITARVYPTMALGNQAHLYAFNRGSETVTVSELNAWSMKTPRINYKEGR